MLANYHPITATPFRRDEEYREIEPCEVLAPYIRCFWGSERTYVPKAGCGQEQIVVPDKDSLKGSLNQYAETPTRFTWLDRELRVRLPETSSLEERVRITEQLLLQKMESRRSHPIIEETMTNILLHGGSLEPTTEPWGQRTCYIADPEGNLIEIGSFNRPYRA